jgi:hypothetical protein
MANSKISGSPTQIPIQTFYSRIRDEARRIAANIAKLPRASLVWLFDPNQSNPVGQAENSGGRCIINALPKKSKVLQKCAAILCQPLLWR